MMMTVSRLPERIILLLVVMCISIIRNGNLVIAKSISNKIDKIKENRVAKPKINDRQTYSPTPLNHMLLSNQDKILNFEKNKDVVEQEYMTNVAINKSCILSSTDSRSGNFGRLNTENSSLSTMRENNPYIMLDLNDVYFVDHISFSIPVVKNNKKDYDVIEVNCYEIIDPDISKIDTSHLVSSWRREVAMDSENYSFHVHSACALVRIQRHGFGKLHLKSPKVFGAKILNTDAIHCLTNQGKKICSQNGECSDGLCKCKWGYTGRLCEDFDIQFILYLSVALIFFLWFIDFLFRSPFRSIVKVTESTESMTKTDDRETDHGLCKGETKNSKMIEMSYDLKNKIHHRDLADISNIVDGYRLVSSNDKKCIIKKPMVDSIHFSFASPVVARFEKDGRYNFRSLHGLEIQKEYNVLMESLEQAAFSKKKPGIPVSISCATVNQLHKLMTLSEHKVIHFAMHCTNEFMGFECPSGDIHALTIKTLRGTLRSTVTPQTLDNTRLIVLNACNSLLAGQEFILAGFQHVVAFRGKVRDTTASIFTRSFYLALSSGRSVKAAFDSAKEAVFSSPTFHESEANAFCLLPERVQHDEILFTLDTNNCYNKNEEINVEKWPYMKNMLYALPPLNINELVGRNVETWKVLNALINQNRRLVSITGPAGIGKTVLSVGIARHVHERSISENMYKDGVYFVKRKKFNSKKIRPEIVIVAKLVDQFAQVLEKLLLSKAKYNSLNDEKLQLITTPIVQEEGEYDDELICDSNIKSINFLITQKVEAITKILQSCKFLLVLDNVEESESFLRLFLESIYGNIPDIGIIITSETPYRHTSLNLYHQPVLPLSPRDSALLLAKHLSRPIYSNGIQLPLSTLSQHEVVKKCDGNALKIIQTSRHLSTYNIASDCIEI